MSEGMLFTEKRLNNKSLSDCEMALETNGGHYRLYVDRSDKNMFYAIAVEFVSCVGDDLWSCPELEVEELFNLVAYFDGVRHLEFNREAGDMAGYINYPNIDGLIQLFQKVREIELEVCRDCDKNSSMEQS